MEYTTIITLIFIFLEISLFVCAAISWQLKEKKVHKEMSLTLLSISVPLIGNLLITVSFNYTVSLIGYYIYLTGTNVLFCLVTLFFLKIFFPEPKPFFTRLLLTIVALDTISILTNPLIGHVFSIEPVIGNSGHTYYGIVSFTGHYIHLISSYLLFVNILLILCKGIKNTPNVYRERYIVILISFLITAVWESHYIFTKIPVDVSMIGYAICGIAIFYFIFFYKPIFFISLINRKVLESSSTAYIFFDRENNGFYANAAARTMLSITDSSLENSFSQISALMNTDLSNTKSTANLKSTRIGKKGSLLYYKYAFTPILDAYDNFLGSYFTADDYTSEELENQKQLYFSRHDSLTGLYNREYFSEKAEKFLKATDKNCYIMVLDINDFKLINDIFGYNEGNKVLKKIADNLRSGPIDYPVYGRIGGDVFAVLATEQNIMKTFEGNKNPISLMMGEKSDYPVLIHYGIYKIEDSSMDVDFMIDRAFMAIDKIKNDYTQTFAFYDNEIRNEKVWEQKIVGMLKEALHSNQIVPFLQPQIDSQGKLTGAEALVRWIHTEDGLLPPYKFIPFFERNGLITVIDQFIWEESCKILRRWQDMGIKDISISVNISQKDFYFTDLYKTFSSLVKKYDIPSSLLHLEITETVVMSDLENRLKTLRDLQSAGFLIEIDDFGSGYSSLNTLKDIPLDVLKIDMLFLYKTQDQNKANIILKTIIDLATRLHLPTITEGVETEEQLKMLIEMGGDTFQGYYFSKPIPLDEFERKFLQNDSLN